MTNTICCYERTNPERQYLAYYCYTTDKEAEEEVRRINEEKPELLPIGIPAECDKYVYFVKKQEEMY